MVGDIHGPKPYKFIGFGDIHGLCLSNPRDARRFLLGSEKAASTPSRGLGPGPVGGHIFGPLRPDNIPTRIS